MRIPLLAAAVIAAAFLLHPQPASAASAAEDHLGKVLIDVSGHGEAWWVNPRTHMRVYLGRPEQALERLSERAFHVNWSNIVRLSETDAAASEAEYAASVAGHVIAPNDVIGAAWYVDPSSGLRRRLALPSDAWAIMRDGAPVAPETLAGIPIEPDAGPRIVEAKVATVLTGTTVELEDGTEVVLASVDVPANPELQDAAKARLRSLLEGRTVSFERDVKSTDESGRDVRFVHAGPVNVSIDLVRYGLAFHDFGFPNLRYAEQLVVAGIDAARHGHGFWKSEVK